MRSMASALGHGIWSPSSKHLSGQGATRGIDGAVMSDPITSAQSGPLDLHCRLLTISNNAWSKSPTVLKKCFSEFQNCRESEQEGGSDELFGSSALNQYESMFDEHLARELAGKLGVAVDYWSITALCHSFKQDTTAEKTHHQQ